MADETMTGDDEDNKPTGVTDSDAGPIRENKDGSVDVVLDDEDAGDTVEHEDGSAEVTLDDEPEDNNLEFYDNLVPILMAEGPGHETARQILDDISLDLIDKVEEDMQSRSPRDEKYAEGIKRTGFSDDAPGGAQFMGASRVAHPMLAQASIDYEARAIKEAFPAAGPAKAHIVGTITKRRQEKATRVARCLNWQLTTQQTEFRPNLERGLMQSALNGVSYIHWIPRDTVLRRTSSQLVNADKVIIASEANDFYSAERITILDDITQMVYETRLDSGEYWEDPMMSKSSPPSQAPDRTKAEEARDKVEGKTTTVRNDDGVRRVYVVNTFLKGIEDLLDDPAGDSEGYLPYLVYIDEETYKVVGLTRNWEQEDEKFQRMHWLTELPFVPWEESNIGLVHLIGGLSAATTGALRALLDSAHVNNIPTAALLKGSGVSGQSKTMSPTQIYEIEGGIGADDIRKVMMQMPYNEPSAVLYQLMTFLVESSEGVVRTTFDNLSDNGANQPVGTTFALIEQGLTVVSAIMARLHFAMQHAFTTLSRINRMYLSDIEVKNAAGEVLAYQSDFTGPMDVVPVSDPNIPSDSHRTAQTQALAARADAKPQLYNAREVERKVLEQLRIADPDRYLAPQQQAVEMNAANENMAATLGRPIMAYPEQDHLSHIKTHIDFMQSQYFGFLSIIAPTFLPPILDHLKEHLALWYVAKVFESLKTSVQASKGPLHALSMGSDITDFMKMGNSEVNAEMDKLIATVSDDVLDPKGDMSELIKLQLPQVVQKAQQILQMYKPPQPTDPAQTQLQKSREDNQTKLQIAQQTQQSKVTDLQERRQDRAQQAQDANADRQTKVQLSQAEQEKENDRETARQTGETARTDRRVSADLQMNDDDNRTALLITDADIAAGKHSNRTTGGDTSPGS